MKQRPFARTFFLLIAVALACTSAAPRPALAQDARSKVTRYDELVIEYVALEPQVKVENVGDGPHRPSGDTSRITVFLYNLRDSEVYAAVDWAGAAERQEIGYMEPGESKAVSISVPTADIPYDKPILAQVYNMSAHRLEETDRITLHGEKAMRIALLVEKRTWDAGTKRYGSFTRHMRESLESLHDLFSATAAPAEAGLTREPVKTRFRIERVELFDRPADSTDAPQRPALLDSHPNYDLVIVCDQNGPYTGYRPTQYAVGADFAMTDADDGLASASVQEGLWKSLVQFTGVPDFAMYRVSAGALPGRCDEAIDLPEPFRSDLMNGPAPSPRVGALSAAIANANEGISRLGDTDAPSNEYARIWRWLPKSVRVQILDDGGKPLAGAKVAWYRSMPLSSAAAEQGVAAERRADGSATTDRQGEAAVDGDYLGVKSEAPSRWLLVEVEHGGRRRFGIIPGLWLNAAYAAGSHDEALWSVRLSDLREVK